jgi:hypothetical protein
MRAWFWRAEVGEVEAESEIEVLVLKGGRWLGLTRESHVTRWPLEGFKGGDG